MSETKIILLTNVRHDGKVHALGSRLSVEKALAEHLLERGYAKKTPSRKRRKPKAKPSVPEAKSSAPSQDS